MRNLRIAKREIATALIAHPSAELYGSDRMMLETVQALVERDWRVVVAFACDGPLVAITRRLGAETVVLAVPVLRRSTLQPRSLTMFLAGSLGASRRIDALLKRVKPDVVYVSTITVPLWIARARANHVPVLAHVHESEREMSTLLREALGSPLLLANRIVSNSEHSLASLTTVLPSLARRATVIYNGVAAPAAVTLPRAEIDGAFRVAYVGRLSPRKGVDVAIDAIAMLHRSAIPVHLDIIGGVFAGYEWYETQLREQTARLGLGDQVTFHGFQPSIWDSLAAVDAVVVPSRVEEPFLNTAVEALLAARPAVVSATGGIAEAIDGFASVIPVEPDDSHELASGLLRILTGWAVFRRSAVAFAPIAVRRFSTDVYHEAIAAEFALLAPNLFDSTPMAIAS